MNRPVAVHQGHMKIGDLTIDCAILNDGRHILVRQSFWDAIGISPDDQSKGPSNRIDFEHGIESTCFVSCDGVRLIGYEAHWLHTLCYLLLQLRRDGLLRANELYLAKRAQLILVSLVLKGIDTLVHDATRSNGHHD